MFRGTCTLLARGIAPRRRAQLYGAPGAPVIRMKSPKVPWKWKNYDIVVEHTHKMRISDSRLLHYLGKHCPHPQKSLWSPDTPVAQDRHLFKLTTVDIDAFKYWFGVKRARVERQPWELLARSGLLPPAFRDNNPLVPKPIFEKEALMRYYLANRKPRGLAEAEAYQNYQNSMTKTDAERAADRPRAPWL